MNEQLKQLLFKETGDHIVTGKLDIKQNDATTVKQVWDEVRNFQFTSGWLCLTDKVVQLYSIEEILNVQNGIILSAELANDSESLHIRQAETGWTITRFKTREGEECLMFREEYVSTENKQRDRLQYDVYWKLDNVSYRPWAARFAGMVKGGTE